MLVVTVALTGETTEEADPVGTKVKLVVFTNTIVAVVSAKEVVLL